MMAGCGDDSGQVVIVVMMVGCGNDGDQVVIVVMMIVIMMIMVGW